MNDASYLKAKIRENNVFVIVTVRENTIILRRSHGKIVRSTCRNPVLDYIPLDAYTGWKLIFCFHLVYRKGKEGEREKHGFVSFEVFVIQSIQMYLKFKSSGYEEMVSINDFITDEKEAIWYTKLCFVWNGGRIRIFHPNVTWFHT